ncbi:MAG: hypothetical protein U1F25_17375 [Rubrivivax sp.]
MHAVSRIAEAPADERGAAAAMAAAAARDEAADPRDALTQTLFAANLVAGTLSADPALPERRASRPTRWRAWFAARSATSRLLVFDRPPGFDGGCNATPTLAERLQDAAAALAARSGREVRVQAEEAEPPQALRSELLRLAQAALAQAEQPSPWRWAARPTLSTCWRVGVAHAGRQHRRSAASPSGGGDAGPQVEIELRWHDQPKQARNRASRAAGQRKAPADEAVHTRLRSARRRDPPRASGGSNMEVRVNDTTSPAGTYTGNHADERSSAECAATPRELAGSRSASSSSTTIR